MNYTGVKFFNSFWTNTYAFRNLMYLHGYLSDCYIHWLDYDWTICCTNRNRIHFHTCWTLLLRSRHFVLCEKIYVCLKRSNFRNLCCSDRRRTFFLRECTHAPPFVVLNWTGDHNICKRAPLQCTLLAEVRRSNDDWLKLRQMIDLSANPGFFLFLVLVRGFLNLLEGMAFLRIKRVLPEKRHLVISLPRFSYSHLPISARQRMLALQAVVAPPFLTLFFSLVYTRGYSTHGDSKLLLPLFLYRFSS